MAEFIMRLMAIYNIPEFVIPLIGIYILGAITWMRALAECYETRAIDFIGAFFWPALLVLEVMRILTKIVRVNIVDGVNNDY